VSATDAVSKGVWNVIRTGLLGCAAAALALASASAVAQIEQKGAPDKGGPGGMPQSPPAQTQPQGPQGPQGKSEGPGQPDGARRAEPKAGQPDVGKGTKGTAEKGTEPKDRKGTAEKGMEPRDRKGTAEKGAEPKDRKGTAEKGMEPKDRKGTAEKGMEPKDRKGTAEKGAEPKDRAKGTAEKGTSGRVQLSEQQRGDVGRAVLQGGSVNRVTRVNFSVDVGVRVPRSVRLAVLPASVVAIVPEYRSYRYFVVDERLCIVDPATYEIVEIVTIEQRTAGRPAAGRLTLTEREKEIILREVEISSERTLGLGALSEGASVPRDVELRSFPEAVVAEVPKVREYKYFTAEERVIIVEPAGARIALVIGEDRRR